MTLSEKQVNEFQNNRLYNLRQHVIRHSLAKGELAAWASEFGLCSINAAKKMEIGELRTLIIDECTRRIDSLEGISSEQRTENKIQSANVIHDRLVAYQQELVERADSLDKFSVTIMPGGDLSGHAAEVRRIADELNNILLGKEYTPEVPVGGKEANTKSEPSETTFMDALKALEKSFYASIRGIRDERDEARRILKATRDKMSVALNLIEDDGNFIAEMERLFEELDRLT